MNGNIQFSEYSKTTRHSRRHTCADGNLDRKVRGLEFSSFRKLPTFPLAVTVPFGRRPDRLNGVGPFLFGICCTITTSDTVSGEFRMFRA